MVRYSSDCPSQDVKKTDVPVEALPEVTEDLALSKAPPLATIARRAQSYSDFHNLSHPQHRDDRRLERKRSLGVEIEIEPRASVQSELDFAYWYAGFEDELLDTSHEEYT